MFFVSFLHKNVNFVRFWMLWDASRDPPLFPPMLYRQCSAAHAAAPVAASAEAGCCSAQAVSRIYDAR